MQTGQKVCIVCKESKQLLEFANTKVSGKVYKRSYCKKCKYQKDKAGKMYATKARERAKKSHKKRYAPHPRVLLNGTYYKRKPHIKKAHNAVQYAKANNKLKRQTCRDCKSINTYGHHPDYSKPLYVIWLCPKHHSIEHKLLKDNRV